MLCSNELEDAEEAGTCLALELWEELAESTMSAAFSLVRRVRKSWRSGGGGKRIHPGSPSSTTPL